jgi:cell division protein FtsX
MFTLFIGGMFIHPLAMLLSKALKRPGKHDPQNPLGKLALESTIIVFVGLFLAFYVSKLQIEWFYPIMLMIIGVRYLIFQTIYGSKLYWALGAVLTLAGVYCILLGASFLIGAFIGGLTEILFAFAILHQSRKLGVS